MKVIEFKHTKVGINQFITKSRQERVNEYAQLLRNALTAQGYKRISKLTLNMVVEQLEEEGFVDFALK